MRFDYQIVLGQGVLPICQIQLVGPNVRVPVRVLIDSGAHQSVLPRKAAQDAGINLPAFANARILYGGGYVEARVVTSYFYLGSRRLV